jgi:c-di-GMP-binding flagellar brake protein YcgR
MSDDSQPHIVGTEQVDNLLSLDLGIGDAIQLQDTQGDKLRYYARLIGFMNKSGIVVSHPVKGDGLLPVDLGQSFQVRGFSGRRTYEFNAYVLAISAEPYPHLHLTFPKKVECMTMRGALRVKPKSLSGWVEPWGESSVRLKEPMAIVDLSTSGARVHSKRHIGKIGEQATIMLRLPADDEEQVLSIPSIIRKSYNETLPGEKGETEVTTYGLEFIQSEGHVRMALQSYVYKTMAEGGD